MGFTIIHPQGYYILLENIQWVGKLISNFKLELNMGPSQTAQISEHPRGGKYSLKCVVIRCAEEAKLGYKNKFSSRKLIRSHDGRVTKIFKNQIICDDERVKKTKIPWSTNPSNLLHTLLLPLSLRQYQLLPRHRGRVGHPPERFTPSVDYKGEVMHVT